MGEEYLKYLLAKNMMFSFGEDRNYELGSHETKSGNPETIRYEYCFDYNDEEDETYNQTITF